MRLAILRFTFDIGPPVAVQWERRVDLRTDVWPHSADVWSRNHSKASKLFTFTLHDIYSNLV